MLIKLIMYEDSFILTRCLALPEVPHVALSQVKISVPWTAKITLARDVLYLLHRYGWNMLNVGYKY